MKSFLDHHQETFELLVFEHLKKIKENDSEYFIRNEKNKEIE